MPHAHPRGYDELPEVIRALVTAKEYAWLSDTEKANIVESFTEPSADMEDQIR